jgi:hypothetical protein
VDNTGDSDTRGLRIAIQAIGVYFVCNIVYRSMLCVAQAIAARFVNRIEPVPSFLGASAPMGILRAFVFPHLVSAVPYLLIGWGMLAKTDWVV